jgi:hypothetical protein
LFTWDVLNRALDEHQFAPRRLAVVKAGRHVEPARFLRHGRVDAINLMQALEDGGTLIFNSCDELHTPLRDLCVSLERVFHANVYANLYAGWRTDNGFEVHWDDQDTLILQIAGRKHWKVWAPTRLYPFKRDIVDTSQKTRPQGPPLWEGVLEQGGILNIPRGWWHVAHPINESCLHVTVTVETLNGVGFVHWLAHQLKACEAARMPLPILASEDERQGWLDGLWRELRNAWTSDIIDRYLVDVDASVMPRPRMRLPHLILDESTREFGPNAMLELAVPRPLAFQIAGGSARFRAKGTDWTTTSDLVASLDVFNDGLPHTVAELCSQGDPKLPALLTALVIKGVLRQV